MKTIWIDVDGTICNNVYYQDFNAELGINLTEETMTKYSIEDNYPCSQQHLQNYYKRLVSHNIYDYAHLLPDAKEVIEKLNEKYKVYLCSSCALSSLKDESGLFFKEKYDFLRKELPFINPKNYIFTGAKTLIPIDIAIDDKAKNLMGEGVKMRLLFTAFHNKNITDSELASNNMLRVNSWKEIEKLLLTN